MFQSHRVRKGDLNIKGGASQQILVNNRFNLIE